MAWPEKSIDDLEKGSVFRISDVEEAREYKFVSMDTYEDEDGNVDEERVMITALRVSDNVTRYIEFEVDDPVYIKPTIIYPQRKVRL
mgnify:CR=1 FL=1